MPDSERHFERYLAVLVRYCSPEELEGVLKCASPEELKELLTFAVDNKRHLSAYLALLEEITTERRDRQRLKSAVALFWNLVWKIGLGVGALIGLWSSIEGFARQHGWWK